MSKIMNCRDVGVDCDFVARGESEDDIMQQAAEHARSVHGYDEVPPEMVEKVKSSIREE